MKARHAALIMGFGLLVACSSQPVSVQGLHFNSIEVVNLTRDDIRNMKIRVTRFNSKFACGIILHRSTCMIGFHPRELQGNDIVISWEVRGQQHQMGPVRVLAPEKYDASITYAVRFLFSSVNQIDVEFHPSSY